MSTTYIPNTNVRALVLDPKPGKDFVPLYENNAASSQVLLSVNAGTSNTGCEFAVGLGGINGSFATALHNAGQDETLYQNLHKNLYLKSGITDSAFEDSFRPADPVQFLLVQKPKTSSLQPKPGITPFYDGTAFVDIFRDKEFPNGMPVNYGMLYLMPPKRSNYSNDADFLTAVEVASETIVAAVESYNAMIVNDGLKLNKIEVIRMCLFSGAIYAGGVAQDKIALSNLSGLEKGWSGINPTVAAVEFENSFDRSSNQNVFRAIISHLTTK